MNTPAPDTTPETGIPPGKAWRYTRRILLSTAVLATLLALFYTIENWRGERAWERFKAEQESNGRSLEWSLLIPHPVDDASNIFKAPKMHEWFVGRGATELSARLNHPDSASVGTHNRITNRVQAAEYLAWSDQIQPELAFIREGSTRPLARMDGNYDQPFEIPIPNFVTLRALAQTLAQRAHCHLLLGQAGEALEDLSMLHDLSRFLEGRPMTLVSAMINVAIQGLYGEVVSEGLRTSAWSSAQLAALDAQLEHDTLSESVLLAFDHETVAVTHTLNQMPLSSLAALMTFIHPKPTLRQRLSNPKYLLILGMPRGWKYQNAVTTGRWGEQRRSGITADFVEPAKIERSTRKLESQQSRPGPYAFLSAWALPNYLKATQALARNETQLRQARIVAALQRYKLAHNSYPETLDALAPQFLPQIPRDFISGNPMRYRALDGTFVLYSIGWNGTDDGGAAAFDKDGRFSTESGDWVWAAPRL